MTVEEDLSRYATVLKKLVHPAGGLLLPRQTITTEVDLVSIITFGSIGGVPLTLTIEPDSLDPPHSKTITVSAPEIILDLVLNVGETPSVAASLEMTLPEVTVLLGIPVATNIISVSNSEETQSELVILTLDAAVITVSASEEREHLLVPIDAVSINITANAVTEHLAIPVGSVAITVSNAEESEHLVVPAYNTAIGVTAPTTTIVTSVNIAASSAVIIINAGEETQAEVIGIPVTALTVTITAPSVSVSSSVLLDVTYDTNIESYETQQPGDYETDPLVTVVNWEANRLDVIAPNITIQLV